MSRRPLFLKFRKYTGSISLFPLLWQILKYPVAITFPFPVGNNDIPVSSPGSLGDREAAGVETCLPGGNCLTAGMDYGREDAGGGPADDKEPVWAISIEVGG